MSQPGSPYGDSGAIGANAKWRFGDGGVNRLPMVSMKTTAETVTMATTVNGD